MVVSLNEHVEGLSYTGCLIHVRALTQLEPWGRLSYTCGCIMRVLPQVLCATLHSRLSYTFGCIMQIIPQVLGAFGHSWSPWAGCLIHVVVSLNKHLEGLSYTSCLIHLVVLSNEHVEGLSYTCRVIVLQTLPGVVLYMLLYAMYASVCEHSTMLPGAVLACRQHTVEEQSLEETGVERFVRAELAEVPSPWRASSVSVEQGQSIAKCIEAHLQDDGRCGRASLDIQSGA